MLSIVLMSPVGKVERQEVSLPRDFNAGVFLPAAHILKQNLTPASEAYQYGLRLAVTLALTAGVARYLSLLNDYWAPMTAVLLLKPDFHQTFVRE